MAFLLIQSMGIINASFTLHIKLKKLNIKDIESTKTLICGFMLFKIRFNK